MKLHSSVDKMQSNLLNTVKDLNMKDSFADLTCKLWSPEAAQCKASEELKCGLEGAEEPPLVWALRKFWHCGLAAGLEACIKDWIERVLGNIHLHFKDFSFWGHVSSLEAGPWIWMEHSGIWKRSKDLWQEVVANVLSQLLALCNVSGSPWAVLHFVYQSHAPVALRC